MNKLTLTSAPHIRSKSQLSGIMLDVVIALLPATALSVYMFGMSSITVLVVTIVSGLLFEAAILKMRGSQNITSTLMDGSALVTTLLLALNLPPSSPIWLAIAGSFVAIVITKHTFGGLGYNVFNPAIAARVFLLISFPVQMTKWTTANGFSGDSVTTATPLDVLKTEGLAAMQGKFQVTDMFFGHTPGSLGEMSAIALLIGAVYLFVRKVITWEIPLIALGSLFLFTGTFWIVDPTKYASPVFHILSGGAIIGAFFMATDMVTSPVTRKGMIVFALGIGLITGIIRLYGGYPEGISFAILIMNSLVPLIDKYIKVKKFGT